MIGFDFDIGTAVLSEYDDDGFLGVQFDALGEENSGVPAYEAHHPYGFMGRPLDPDVDDTGAPALGAAVAKWTEGGYGHAMALGDPRLIPILPTLQLGESIQYGSKGQFVRCHADGSISIYTTHDGTPDGRAIALTLTPTTGLEFQSPWGTMRFGPQGFHVVHSSGARLDLGSNGLPAPLSALGSYAKLQAAMASVRGTPISLGTDGGAANTASLAALTTLLTALGTVIAAAVDPTGIPAAAKTAFATALATALPLIQDLGKIV